MNPEKNFRQLPSVDKVLHTGISEELIERHGRAIVTYAVRRALQNARISMEAGENKIDLSPEGISHSAGDIVKAICEPSLKPVINATGILLHTNLGRAPLGDAVVEGMIPVISGYSNLEFDLQSASRGHRTEHLSEFLTYLTGAEGIIIVNNNAAGIILALSTFASGKEVIISRGELIEIGGAFRIPEIMAASGAKMIEVGTTNRTRLSDYEQAINPATAAIFKAHKSNYTIEGFTEEVSVRELSILARSYQIPLFYDIGSGLLRKPDLKGFENEPNVQSAINDGAELVMFSGDKLLGGPQAGIIAGRRELVSALSRAPLMRALRVGKLTIAALSQACRSYLSDKSLVENNPVFYFLHRKDEEKREIAVTLKDELAKRQIASEISESTGQCGGGTLPDLKIPSYAVTLISPVKDREAFAESVFHNLLKRDLPVLGILREGRIVFDVFALSGKDLPVIVEATVDCVRGALQ
ncbi:MAG: L-seryl-tRNA(Sec) selenium transferase [Fibrobacter sp.]|nr:L-seryl-tRNA(Sec) selenium transferase [Fibrobacter sp.]